jgi:hypothetical protein
MHDQADMYESARVRCVRLLTYIDSLATTTSDPSTTHKQVAPVTVRKLRLMARDCGALVTVNTSP